MLDPNSSTNLAQTYFSFRLADVKKVTNLLLLVLYAVRQIGSRNELIPDFFAINNIYVLESFLLYHSGSCWTWLNQ